jgi:ankyrin repeat protein
MTGQLFTGLQGMEPQNVTSLSEAGADAAARNEAGKTPWDLAKDNGKLTRTDAYGALSDARLK